MASLFKFCIVLAFDGRIVDLVLSVFRLSLCLFCTVSSYLWVLQLLKECRYLNMLLYLLCSSSILFVKHILFFQHQLSSFDTCMPKKWLSQMLFFFQFVDRLALIFMPKKYQPDHMYLRHVPIKRVHLFTLFQIISLAILWVVKMIKSISILFPVMVTFSLDILVYNYKVYDWIWMNIHYFWLKKCLLPSLSFKMLEGVLLL